VPGVLVESSALPGHLVQRPERPRPPSRPTSRHLTAAGSRSALAAAALGLCAVGLLGVDAGLVWAVVGVFGIRALTQDPVDLAWGIACLGAGLRWGTFSIGDIEVATRLFGPTVVSGSFAVRVGMGVALSAAVLGECRTRGFRATSWSARAAAAAAVLVLVPVFVVGGTRPEEPIAASFKWAAGAVTVAVALVVLEPVARRLPSWFPSVAAAVGVLLAGAAA
jgi:hypothetical protein